MKEDIITFDDLLSKIKVYIKNKEEIEIIKKAYQFASTKHFGQKRLDGNDFINHPLNVAMILTELRGDYETITAALLHEIISFAGVSYDLY